MRFDFDEDQQAIRNDARRFLTERCAMDSVRDYLEGDQADVSPLWHEMSELGWQGVAIPEAFGGLGMGYLELCLGVTDAQHSNISQRTKGNRPHCAIQVPIPNSHALNAF